MTELFDRCIEVILRNEGNFQDDPDDPGNYADGVLKGTKYGISARAFPELDIKHLTIDEAKEIYYDNYWLPLKLEGLEDVNAALQIFDMGVNAGLKRAVKIAQKCSGAYEDGIMGVATTIAINATENFVDKYQVARIKFYNSLPGAGKYLKGWTKRVLKTVL